MRFFHRHVRLCFLALLTYGSSLFGVSGDEFADIERDDIMTEFSTNFDAVWKITKDQDFRKVQRRLERSEAESILIKIAPGAYTLESSLHINRSNVTVRGEEGAVLRLADGALCPVVAVGTQSEIPHEDERIYNIAISGLVLDGNRDAQPSEFDRVNPWIRNNGIDVRTVTRLWVEDVRGTNNRSGGFVISWRCRDVVARDCVFDNNYFDGVAYYDSESVYTVDCQLIDNRGAGVSLDNRLVNSVFARCEIRDNEDVGVFARNSRELVFYDSDIVGSGNWAFFLSHDDAEHGIFDSEINNCRIRGNNGGVRMGSITEEQSSGNRVVASVFAGNDQSGRSDLDTAGSVFERLEGGWNGDEENAYAREVDPYLERIYNAFDTTDFLGGPKS